MYNRITFKLDGIEVQGILLAEYDIHIPCILPKKNKFLFFSFKRFTETTKKTKQYLVFVAWKHALKEIMPVYEEQIISIDYDKSVEWVSIDSFVSKYQKEYDYADYLVENFKGYKFIFENNGFIAQVRNDDLNQTTEILYKYIPKLLEEEFDETNAPKHFPLFITNAERMGTGYIELQYEKPKQKNVKRKRNDNPKHFKEDSLFIGVENINLFESQYMNIFRKVAFCKLDVFSFYTCPLDGVRIIRSLINEQKPIEYEVILKWLDVCIENGYSLNFLGI